MLSKFILLLLLPALGHHSDTSAITGNVAKGYTIYLTFDDGPDYGSMEISSLIAQEQVRTTAFLKGRNIWYHAGAAHYYYLYLDNPYMECGNRGFLGKRKRRSYYADPEYVLYDFALNAYYLSFKNMMCRLPGANCWRVGGRSYDASDVTRTSADLLASYECKVLGWDLDWTANHRTGVLDESPEQMISHIEEMLNNGKTFTHGHLVLRCRDTYFRKSINVEKMKVLIEKLKSKGVYRFEYLSNYPAYSLTACEDSIYH